jgi:hypothetical protein
MNAKRDAPALSDVAPVEHATGSTWLHASLSVSRMQLDGPTHMLSPASATAARADPAVVGAGCEACGQAQ